MNQRHKHYDIIVAWAEGKQIQRFDAIDLAWVDVRGTPGFSENAKYRVKPVTIKYRVFLGRYEGVAYGGTKFYPVVVMYEEQQKEDREKWQGFIRWLTDWQEVEV